jgi:hypothetical protein
MPARRLVCRSKRHKLFVVLGQGAYLKCTRGVVKENGLDNRIFFYVL